MSEFSTPRLGAGVHTGDGAFRRGKGSGEREPVRWDVLFPKGRRGVWRLCLVGAVAAAVGGVILWLALRGDPSAPSDGGDSPQNGMIPAETTAEAWETTAPIETADGPEPDTEPAADPGADGDESDDGAEGAKPAESARPADTAEPITEGVPAVTEPNEDSDSEDPTNPPAETEPPPADGSETAGDELRPVPEGCYPILPSDVSESERGAGYLVGEIQNLPARLPAGALWTGDEPPAVLLVHTHPFEGYGDGKAWYDPASGGLAQTETIHDSDGVVALGAALARGLREHGITVMHLRIAASAEDTAAETYDRVRAAVASYLTLYPDIGLVLDLRRSAELSEDGSILRTMGKLEGDTCAQVRISVSGDRSEELVGRDLSAALTLRETLWETAPTISRPVWVKSGSGLAGESATVCTLTLELGSAGNTYAEAARLTDPLASAVSRLVGAEGEG